MHSPHSIRVAAAALAAGALLGMLAQTRARAQAHPASNFTVLFQSRPIGSEQVTVERSAQGWNIASSGRIGPPFERTIRALQIRYDTEWKPLELSMDATIRDETATLRTTVTGTTARSDVAPANGAPVATSDEVDPQAVLLLNPFVAPYEALSARLKTATAGSRISIYQPRGGPFLAEVGESSTEQVKTLDRMIRVQRTKVVFRSTDAPPMDLQIWGDEEGRLLRVSIPSQGLDFIREDIASVSARVVTMSRPNDEDVRIPANGFSLAGTISKPPTASGPLPAVILVGGSELVDRDEVTYGVPLFGQIADALANAGFLVLRYDKRGVGQSGGRVEAARLAEFAEDVRAAVKFLGGRKDVDRKRLALVGHGEGGWIAMMAAAKNDRVSSVGLLATVAVTGQELNLYQVKRGAERSGRSQTEQQATVDLQKQIQQAVISGSGWDTINVPEAVRRQAETPYFQSFLTLDPAKIIKDVRQPLLVIQGDLDTQVPPSSAEQLETLAKGRKKAAPVDIVKVPGINHLLAPAVTGEVDEYASLPERKVSPAVTEALVNWLQKTPAGK